MLDGSVHVGGSRVEVQLVGLRKVVALDGADGVFPEGRELVGDLAEVWAGDGLATLAEVPCVVGDEWRSVRPEGDGHAAAVHVLHMDERRAEVQGLGSRKYLSVRVSHGEGCRNRAGGEEASAEGRLVGDDLAAELPLPRYDIHAVHSGRLAAEEGHGVGCTGAVQEVHVVEYRADAYRSVQEGLDVIAESVALHLEGRLIPLVKVLDQRSPARTGSLATVALHPRARLRQ